MNSLLQRPTISIILFNKDHESAKTLLDSIYNIADKRILARTEFIFVVYDKNFTKENEQNTFKLRKFMTVRVMDAVPENLHPDLETYKKYYLLGYKVLEKKENDTVTEDELRTIIEQYLTDIKSKSKL